MIDKIIDLVMDGIAWIVENFTIIFIAGCLLLGYIIGAKEVGKWWQNNDGQAEDYFCSAWAERTDEKSQTRKQAGSVNLFILKKKDDKGVYQQHLNVYTSLTNSFDHKYDYTPIGVAVLERAGTDEFKSDQTGNTLKRKYHIAFQKQSKVLTLQVDVQTIDANGVILTRDLSNITAYCGLK